MKNKLIKLFSSPIFCIGIFFILSPFILAWFMHGDYGRYIETINGPFPFSHLGGGPFQFAVSVGFFLVGLVFLLIDSIRRKYFKSMILSVFIVIVVIFAVYSIATNQITESQSISSNLCGSDKLNLVNTQSIVHPSFVSGYYPDEGGEYWAFGSFECTDGEWIQYRSQKTSHSISRPPGVINH